MRIGGLLLLHTFGKKRLKVASVALKPVRVPVSSPCLASGWDLRKFTDRLRVYAIACGLVIVALMQHEPSASAQQPDRFAGPTSSTGGAILSRLLRQLLLPDRKSTRL